MTTLLRNILIGAAHHPFFATIVLMVVFGIVLRLTSFHRIISRICQRSGRNLLVIISLVILATYLGIVIWYLFLPGFAGELEPMIASVAWWVQQGEPLYHGFDSAERYSVLYGPMGFLTNAFFMQLLGPSIFSAKLGGVLAAVLGLLCLFLALDKVVSRRMALGFTALTTILYGVGGSFTYMIRPDPFLVACVCFGLLCAVRARPALAILGTALALSYCVNLKIHAGLFFLPIFAVLYRRVGPRAVLLSLITGFLMFWLPFLLYPQISLRNYLLWLSEATRHGLDFYTFQMTLQLALFLSLPMLVFLLPGFRATEALRKQEHYLLALLICTIGVLILASKPGAGLNHLMPLIPLVLFGTATLLSGLKNQAGEWNQVFSGVRLGTAIAIGLVAMTTGIVTEYRSIMMTRSYTANCREVTQDISRILEAYPGQTIGMAYGGEGDIFRLTAYRPLLVFAGQPILLDVIAVMESDCAHRPLPEKTYEAIAAGQVTVWLVPKAQEPFQKHNWYPNHDEIFPDDFRQLFQENFRCRDKSAYFDLWFHNGVAPEVGSVLQGRSAVVYQEGTEHVQSWPASETSQVLSQ